MGYIIAVSNIKGGIGKTTTVVNIGAGLALKGARVLLVDMDPQSNLAMALGVHPRRTLYDILADGVQAASCTLQTRPNLDLIAADQSLLGVQPLIASRPDWSRLLEQRLRPLTSSYDFILLDSGGSLTMLNVNALVAASAVLVPTAIEHFSLKSIELLFSVVQQVKGSSSSIRMIIPTMYDARVRQSSELLERLRTRYGSLVTAPVRVNVRLSEAPTLGQTIYEYAPRSRGAADYALLVEQISALFGFQKATQTAEPVRPRVPSNGERSTPLPSSQLDTQQHSQPEPAAPALAPAASAYSLPQSCPYCSRPLQYTTLAGYRIAYCDHCKYKAQALVQGPRR